MQCQHSNSELLRFSPQPAQSFVPVSGPLAESINDTWGSFEAFQAAFEGAAAGVQGSGWVWLGQDPATGALSIRTTANQDTLAAKYKLTPLLGVDLWEHSYVRGRAWMSSKGSGCDCVMYMWGFPNAASVMASRASIPGLLNGVSLSPPRTPSCADPLEHALTRHPKRLPYAVPAVQERARGLCGRHLAGHQLARGGEPLYRDRLSDCSLSCETGALTDAYT